MGATFNGWENWDTFEAWNLLSNDEASYNAIKDETTRDNIEAVLFNHLNAIGADIEYIAFSEIHWDELIEAFKEA